MKIVHLADLHLGYRAYSKLSPEGLNIREKDIIKAFKDALDKVIEIKPDLVIIAGDVFHKPRPSNSSIYLAIKLLQGFRQKSSAPVVIISGNHEASKSVESGNILKILETTVSKVRVIDGKIEQVSFEGLDISVLGLPYNALSDFEKTSLLPDKNYKYNVLTVHGSYDSVKCPELTRHTEESLLNSKNLNEGKWSYIALGHYHRYTQLSENTFYSGAIERTSSNIWQESKDSKGFIEYNLVTGENKFHKLNNLREVIDLEKVDALGMTSAEVNKIIDSEINKITDIENKIIRMTFENIDSLTIKNIDYSKIRSIKKRALHFRLNLIKKSYNAESDYIGEVIHKRNIEQCLEHELKSFELSEGVDREKFKKTAKDYLYSV